MKGKIDERYIGLYIITKHYGKGIYSLQVVTDPYYIIPRVSDAQLKPYIDQPDNMQTFHQVIIGPVSLLIIAGKSHTLLLEHLINFSLS